MIQGRRVGEWLGQHRSAFEAGETQDVSDDGARRPLHRRSPRGNVDGDAGLSGIVQPAGHHALNVEIEVRPLVPEFVRERDFAERNPAARIPTLRASIPVESASRRRSVDEHHAPTVAHGGSTPPGETASQG